MKLSENSMKCFAMYITPLVRAYIAEHPDEYAAFLASEQSEKSAASAEDNGK